MADVKLEVFDILGQKIETLINVKQEAGHHAAAWDGKDNPSGTYFYRLQAGVFTECRKMSLVK
jgi:hypothetical protein